ncbi:hypothetical protein E3J85_01215 [Patescibacteria group bacterium]|nr:MAG: hypothetical protein E3J85_01215 [Patescibacteria group bacterium]
MPTSLLRVVPAFLAEAFERKDFVHDINAQNIFGLLVLKYFYNANVEVTTNPQKFPSHEEIAKIVGENGINRSADNLRNFWKEVNKRIFPTEAAHRYELNEEQIEELVRESTHHPYPLLTEINMVIIGCSTEIFGEIMTIWHSNK